MKLGKLLMPSGLMHVMLDQKVVNKDTRKKENPDTTISPS